MATNPWEADAIVQPAQGFTGVIPGVPKQPAPPSGFEPDPGRPGALRPIPGGPDDPEANDTLDDATTTFYAQQVLSGAPMPAMGMGKTAAQNRQRVMKEVARLAGGEGLTGEDLARQITHYKAGQAKISNLEKMRGNIAQAEQTALANGRQFIDRSAELPGQTEYPILNSITQTVQRHTPVAGHETISAMDAAYNTFYTEYAKVVAGSPSGAGVLSDSARREAMETIRSNASLTQKKAAFKQMEADMANRMSAIDKVLGESYDTLTKQPDRVPDAFSMVALPGAPEGGPPDGGSGGAPPPGTKQLTDDQKHAYAAFLAANPKPDPGSLKAFLEKLTGAQVTNADAIADAIAKGAGVSSTVEDKTAQQRVANEDKAGIGDSPVTTLLTQGATLNLSDEAAGVGEAAANILTSPFTGKFHPGQSYALGRDAERLRIENARRQLGWGGTAIEFAGGMASMAPTSALAAAAGDLPALVRQGATGGAYGGALAGFGQGEGTSQSLTGAGVGAAGGAALGVLAPYAASRFSRAPQGMAPDLADAAQAEGVDLIRPMVDPNAISEYGALESNVYSQPIIRGGAARVRGQIEDRAAALGQGGEALEPGAAGERLQVAGNRYITRTRGIKDRLYRRAEAAAGDTRFVPQNAIDQLKADIEELSGNPKSNAATIQFLQDKVADLSTPGGKTVAEIRNIREGLRGEIGTKNLTMTNAERLANNALHAAGDDIAQAAPEAGRLYKRADAFYRERQVMVDDLKRAIIGSPKDPLDPQKAFANIQSLMGQGGNARRLSAVMSHLEPAERQDIAATVAENLGRRAPDEPFSTALFLSQTRKLSPSARRTLFGSDGAQSIDNLRLLSQKLEAAEKDINRSRSATVLERQGWRQAARTFIASIAGIGGTAATGSITGGLAGAGVAGAAMGVSAARRVLSARAMVNPKVSMWLAQAADVSTPSQAKQAVKGLSLIISREPALARELAPVRDFLDQRVTQLLAAKPDDGDNEQRR